MKNLIAITTLFFTLAVSLSAQTEFVPVSKNFMMGVGPIIGYKIGVNAADIEQGTKNGVAQANMPDFGAQFYMPFSKENTLGLILDATYANNQYLLKPCSGEFTERFQYFAIGANFYLSGFTIGLNVGIPLGGSKNKDGKELISYKSEMFNTMYEVRIGGNITLNESNTGRMIFFINGGYQINEQYATRVNPGNHARHPASIQLGLGYIINVVSK